MPPLFPFQTLSPLQVYTPEQGPDCMVRRLTRGPCIPDTLTPTVRAVQLRSTLELLELWVSDGTLALAYVLCPCCRSSSIFQRCWRKSEKGQEK